MNKNKNQRRNWHKSRKNREKTERGRRKTVENSGRKQKGKKEIGIEKQQLIVNLERRRSKRKNKRRNWNKGQKEKKTRETK